MIFEFGKKYIVDVTEKGIVPLMEFDEDRWYDKEHDDLDFLTDGEKVVVINTVLDKIRGEIESLDTIMLNDSPKKVSSYIKLSEVREVIDKYKTDSEG